MLNRSQLLKKLKKDPWVQAPLWPEVQNLLNDVKVGSAYFSRGQKTASRELLDLENKHRSWISPIVDLSGFPYAYLTAGVTEALNLWRLTDSRPWQTLEGEYQWPNMISQQHSNTVSYFDDNSVVYISNPACSSGNFLSNSFLENMHNPVILDCAYLGATHAQPISVPRNTEQVMFSFSKAWGIIGQRCGLVYCREPHPILENLKKVECWNYNAAQIVSTLMDRFAVDDMYKKFKPTQDKLCNEYDLTASDTYFIATSEDNYFKERRRAGTTARLCLTNLL